MRIPLHRQIRLLLRVHHLKHQLIHQGRYRDSPRKMLHSDKLMCKQCRRRKIKCTTEKIEDPQNHERKCDSCFNGGDRCSERLNKKDQDLRDGIVIERRRRGAGTASTQSGHEQLLNYLYLLHCREGIHVPQCVEMDEWGFRSIERMADLYGRPQTYRQVCSLRFSQEMADFYRHWCRMLAQQCPYVAHALIACGAADAMIGARRGSIAYQMYEWTYMIHGRQAVTGIVAARERQDPWETLSIQLALFLLGAGSGACCKRVEDLHHFITAFQVEEEVLEQQNRSKPDSARFPLKVHVEIKGDWFTVGLRFPHPDADPGLTIGYKSPGSRSLRTARNAFNEKRIC